jgi:chorismate mutase-like protein
MTSDVRHLILPLGAALVLAGCTTPDGQLASMAEERLALAPDVAWYKHQRDLPVYDPARETAQLQTVVAAGQAAGLPADTVRRFFAAEMEASRRIQWEWIHAWRKDLAPAPEGPVRDLATDLRPQIDEINRRQIEALRRGAQPLTIAQLTALGARFLPKNSLSTPAQSAPSTPPVTAQR